jgi:rhodanese-related sulfurtransferase
MSMSMKDLVAEARGRIVAVSPAQAQAAGELILDVREPDELEQKGRVPDALHVPRGLLEAHADPDNPMSSARLTAARSGGVTVDVLCASGARAALAAATLDRMGYHARVIEGGMKGWQKADLPVED